MKNLNLENLNSSLFGRFEPNRLNDVSSSKVKGGETSTTLCKTVSEMFDNDSQHTQENLSDPRCTGYRAAF